MSNKSKETVYNSAVFHQQLKKARFYRGYKRQSQLAKILNMSRQTYSLLELGRRKPSLEALIRIANYLKVDPTYFVIPEADPADHDRKSKVSGMKVRGN